MEVTEHFTATAAVARGIHAIPFPGSRTQGLTGGWANIAKSKNQHCQQTAVRDRQIRHKVNFVTIPQNILRFFAAI